MHDNANKQCLLSSWDGRESQGLHGPVVPGGDMPLIIAAIATSLPYLLYVQLYICIYTYLHIHTYIYIMYIYICTKLNS